MTAPRGASPTKSWIKLASDAALIARINHKPSFNRRDLHHKPRQIELRLNSESERLRYVATTPPHPWIN